MLQLTWLTYTFYYFSEFLQSWFSWLLIVILMFLWRERSLKLSTPPFCSTELIVLYLLVKLYLNMKLRHRNVKWHPITHIKCLCPLIGNDCHFHSSLEKLIYSFCIHNVIISMATDLVVIYNSHWNPKSGASSILIWKSIVYVLNIFMVNFPWNKIWCF